MKLNDVSPLAGIVSGGGFMGDLASKGGLGLIPMAIAKDKRKDREEEERMRAEQSAGQAPQQGYKKGGSVRGSGCAVRGVKKCKMR